MVSPLHLCPPPLTCFHSPHMAHAPPPEVGEVLKASCGLCQPELHSSLGGLKREGGGAQENEAQEVVWV